MFESVTFGRSKTDQGSLIPFKDFCQQPDSICKIFRIAYLISQTEDSNLLTFQFHCPEFRQQFVPISRKFPVKPGGSTHNEAVISSKIILPGLLDRHYFYLVFTKLFLYFLCHPTRSFGFGSIKQTYLFHNSSLLIFQ